MLGGKLTCSSMNTMLKNRRYVGELSFRDTVVPDAIPAIVPKDPFDRVQKRLEKNKRAPAHGKADEEYLLTTKLFCGHCKSPMTGISGTSRSGNLHYYYVCQKRRTEKTCEKKNLRRDDIELQVAKAIKRRTLDDDTINWIADSVVEYSQHQGKRKADRAFGGPAEGHAAAVSKISWRR